jgi:hypothetical protein
MNEFRASSATNQLIPPWRSKGCQTWSFAVEVGQENVRGYLDKYLNGPYPDRAPYLYLPMPGPQFGLITYAYHPNIFSIDPKQPRDRLSFSEVHWTLPVRRYHLRPDGSRAPTPKIVWLQPFSFCNNASVVFASREIWGADAVFAKITQPASPRWEALHVDVAIEGIKTFSPYSMSQPLGCMHIAKQVGGVADLRDVLERRPNMRDFAKLVESFRGPQAGAPEFNNLKQFRDAYNLQDAVYRALVASRTWHENVSGPVFYDGSSATIDVMWSASVAEMATSLLGLNEPKPKGPPAMHRHRSREAEHEDGVDWDLPRARVEVQLAFSFRSDLRFDVLKTLFTYGAGDLTALRPTSALKS